MRCKRLKIILYFLFHLAFSLRTVLAQMPYILVKENIKLKKDIAENYFKLPFETFKYHFFYDTLKVMKFSIFKGVPRPSQYHPSVIKDANFGTLGFNWVNPKYYGEQSGSSPFAKLLSIIPIPKLTLPKIFAAKK